VGCSASVHFLFVRCSCRVDCFCVFFVLKYMALAIGSEMSTTRELSACLTPSRFILLISTSSLPEVSRSQWPRGLGLGLRPLACWDCVFDSRRRHGCLSLVNVVCCQMFLLWADPSSRGVVPSVMCPSVIAEPQQ